ncbi:MAG: hypothetical protein K0S98_2415 [Propionibacteriaceae bacterium]|nr:hypothetical protein [Propionibacteriaceae bacterium]
MSRHHDAPGSGVKDLVRCPQWLVSKPPSTGSVWPVIQAASLEARNATAAATSSESPTRPKGYSGNIRSAPPSWSPQTRVRMVPGATALTRI